MGKKRVDISKAPAVQTRLVCEFSASISAASVCVLFVCKREVATKSEGCCRVPCSFCLKENQNLLGPNQQAIPQVRLALLGLEVTVLQPQTEEPTGQTKPQQGCLVSLESLDFI